jgi:hypothetical protein
LFLLHPLPVELHRALNRCGRVATVTSTTITFEGFTFDCPKLFSIVKADCFWGRMEKDFGQNMRIKNQICGYNNLRQLLVHVNVPIGEEGHSWKAEILVINEHLNWGQVCITSMINESGHVSIVAGIHTEKGLLVLNCLFRSKLRKKREELELFSSTNNTTNIPGDPSQTGTSPPASCLLRCQR